MLSMALVRACSVCPADRRPEEPLGDCTQVHVRCDAAYRARVRLPSRKARTTPSQGRGQLATLAKITERDGNTRPGNCLPCHRRKSLNAASLPGSAILDILYEGWKSQSAGGFTASWMLHGRPGVGKNQVVQQLADRMGAKLFDLRLTTIEPQDLRGLPYYDHEARKTVWYRPEDLPSDPDASRAPARIHSRPAPGRPCASYRWRSPPASPGSVDARSEPCSRGCRA